MARELLTTTGCTRLRKKGMHGDGGNLYLQVAGGGSKSWIFRYMLDGKSRSLGLGGFPGVSLDKARELAATCRADLAEAKLGKGPTPWAARAARRRELAAAEANPLPLPLPPTRRTFRQCVGGYLEDRGQFRSVKHARQWRSTLDRYAFPLIGDRDVADIDLPAVIDVLRPIWNEKTETASRVRGRIEAVLSWATVNGFRQGDNPAKWHGLLENVFLPKGKLQKAKHHEAMPYAEVPAFMARLGELDSTSSRALQWTILTAVRTSDTIGARWSEIDRHAKVWTIPAERMKAAREHRVPLTDKMLVILDRCFTDGGDFVFIGGKAGQGLSNMAMLELLKGVRPGITVHGFRSTFRDWCGDVAGVDRDLAEAALAHAIRDKTEAAYRRSDALSRRRQLMVQWEAFLFPNTPVAATRRAKVDA